MGDFTARGVCDSSSGGKFWQIEVSGSSFTTTFGKVGDGGTTNTKDFESAEKAMKEAEKLGDD
jgi:predicted DNA-binding WGR domain protein